MNTKLIIAVLWLLATSVSTASTDAPLRGPLCDKPFVEGVSISLSPKAKSTLVKWDIDNPKKLFGETVLGSGCFSSSDNKKYSIILEDIDSYTPSFRSVFGFTTRITATLTLISSGQVIASGTAKISASGYGISTHEHNDSWYFVEVVSEAMKDPDFLDAIKQIR